MKSLKCCKLNLLQMRKQPKYYLCVGFLMLEMWNLFYGITPWVERVGDGVSPWLLTLLPAHENSYAVIMLAFLLLVSDMPFRSGQQRFIIQRTGKRSWILGQFFYLVLLSFLFTLLLFVLSWIYLLPQLRWEAEWGTALETACRYGDAYVSEGIFCPLRVNFDILLNCTGLEATLWNMGSQFLVCVFLGLLVMVCNLMVHPGVGPVIGSAFIFLSFVVRSLSNAKGYFRFLSWISPVSWPDRSLMGFTNQYLPPYAYGILMPLALCTGLLLLLIFRIQKMDVDAAEE